MQDSNPKHRFIGFAGMPNAGKDLCTQYFEQNFGYLHIRMSSIVIKEAQKRFGNELTRSDIQETGLRLREQYGPGVIARRAVDSWLPRLIADKEKEMKDEAGRLRREELRCVFNGVRGENELQVFRKKYRSDFCLIAICASLKTRHERSKLRMRQGFDNFSLKGFEELDSVELTLGVGSAIALADYYVVNEGTKDELFSQLQKSATFV
jgi:dephospho-CoA kinase